MDYIVSGTGIKIYAGSVVMLARFQGTKWLVCNGHYTYGCEQFMGWYFSSIPAGTIIPVNDEDLMMLKVITDAGPCPSPKPPEPGPRPPQPPIYNPEEVSRYLDKTFITVDTIEERDRLALRSLIPDGKLVRVNHVYEESEEEEENIDVGPKYYRYSIELQEFVEISIENEVSGEEFAEVRDCLTWKYLK